MNSIKGEMEVGNDWAGHSGSKSRWFECVETVDKSCLTIWICGRLVIQYKLKETGAKG